MSMTAQSARPLRPQDHRGLRRDRADRRAAEAAARPHRRRHQGGRPRRLERLEGPASAHALLRDGGGAGRRSFRTSRAHGPRAGSRRTRLREALPDWTDAELRGLCSPATTRPTGSRSTLRGRSKHAQLRPRGRAARTDARDRRSRPTPSAASPSSPCSRPTIRACLPSSPAPAPRPAATSSTPRSSRRSTAARSTRSSSRRAFDRDEDELRRAERVARSIESALKGEIRLAGCSWTANGPPSERRAKPFQVAPRGRHRQRALDTATRSSR